MERCRQVGGEESRRRIILLDQDNSRQNRSEPNCWAPSLFLYFAPCIAFSQELREERRQKRDAEEDREREAHGVPRRMAFLTTWH